MHVPHSELQYIAFSVLVCDPFNFNYSPKYENTIWLLLNFIKKKKMEVRKTLGEKEADDEKGRPLDLSPTLPPGEGGHCSLKRLQFSKICPKKIHFPSHFNHQEGFTIDMTPHYMTKRFSEMNVPYFYGTAVYIK